MITAHPRHNLPDVLAKQPRKLIVSITDPGQEVDDSHFDNIAPQAKVVRLTYNAFERDRNAKWLTVTDLEDIAQEARDARFDVIVHCSAGEVRSPAVALFLNLLKAQEEDNIDLQNTVERHRIVQIWREAHPQATPQERTLHIAAHILKLRVSLIEDIHIVDEAKVTHNPQMPEDHTKPQRTRHTKIKKTKTKRKIKGLRH